MTSRKLSVKKSEKLVKEYAPLFGLGHYRFSVTVLPEDMKGKIWGRSNFNHSDEYFDMQIVPDGTLQDTAHRHLILHELAHGIVQYASESDAGLETACNRIAKMVLGPCANSPNYDYCGGENMQWPDSDSYESVVTNRRDILDTDKKDAAVARLLNAVGTLTGRERFVVGAIYVQRMSFRETARALGCSARTIQRLRNSAVRKLTAAM